MLIVKEIIEGFEKEPEINEDTGDNLDAEGNPLFKKMSVDKRMNYMNLFFGLLCENKPLRIKEIIKKGITKQYGGLLSIQYRGGYAGKLSGILNEMEAKGFIKKTYRRMGNDRGWYYEANPEVVYAFLRRYSLTKAEFERYKKVIDDALHSKYLFSWDDVPWKDSKRFRKYLSDNLKIDHTKTQEIEKIDDNYIIVKTGKNPIRFKLNEENGTAIVLSGGRLYKHILKKENGKRNIYSKRHEFKPMEKTALDYGYTLANVNRPVPERIENFVDAMYLFLNSFGEIRQDIIRGCDMLNVISIVINSRHRYINGKKSKPIAEVNFNYKRCPFIGWFKFGYNQTYFPPDYMGALSRFDPKKVKELRKLENKFQKKINDIDSNSTTQEEFNGKLPEANLWELSEIGDLENKIDDKLRELDIPLLEYNYEGLTDYKQNIQEYMDEYFRLFPPENPEEVKNFIEGVPDHIIREIYGEKNWEEHLDNIKK